MLPLALPKVAHFTGLSFAIRCKACDLHAEGKLNILLVPVQGESWEHEGHTSIC